MTDLIYGSDEIAETIEWRKRHNMKVPDYYYTRLGRIMDRIDKIEGRDKSWYTRDDTRKVENNEEDKMIKTALGLPKVRVEKFQSFLVLQTEEFRRQFATYIRNQILSNPSHKYFYKTQDWVLLTKDETVALFSKVCKRFDMSMYEVERQVRGLHYDGAKYGCKFNFDGNFGLFQISISKNKKK